jgi:hypothetical protein
MPSRRPFRPSLTDAELQAAGDAYTEIVGKFVKGAPSNHKRQYKSEMHSNGGIVLMHSLVFNHHATTQTPSGLFYRPPDVSVFRGLSISSSSMS